MASSHDKYRQAPDRFIEQIGRHRGSLTRTQKIYHQSGHLNVGFNYLVKLVLRKDWNAVVPKQSSGYLCKPATHVRLTTTRSSECTDKEGCIKIVQELQSYHMKNGLCDIPYNFMIGGDTSVYEGRGFLWNPLLNEELPGPEGKVLDIALIGTFQDSEPPTKMMNLVIDVINACILKKDLIPKFELIPLPEIRKPILPLFEQEK